MDNLIAKYKMREPQETVRIIQDFFKSRGFSIDFTDEQGDSLGIYSCECTLSIDGQFILSTQGKGMTQDFSHASGLAEMYERFCNKIPYIYHYGFMKNLMEKNYKDFGYYLHPGEKPTEIENMPKAFQVAFENLVPKEEEKDYLQTFFKSQLIGVPYVSCLTDDIYYLDPRILSLLSTSNGMSAGNTVTEALNQGLSEWFERYVSENLYKLEQNTYYELDISSIQNEDLKKKCEILNSGNIKLKIYDLSYNFKAPVLCALLINTKSFEIHPQFGCFPVFDIALERCLTELFQLNEKATMETMCLQGCYNHKEWAYIQEEFSKCHFYCPFIPQEMFTNNRIITEPSHYFIDNYTTNEEIYDYYKKLMKEQGFNFYYCDNSLCHDMAAIHIICENTIGETFDSVVLAQLSNWVKKKIIKQSKNLFIFWESVYNNNPPYVLQETWKNLCLSFSDVPSEQHEANVYFNRLNPADLGDVYLYPNLKNATYLHFILFQYETKQSLTDIAKDLEQNKLGLFIKKYLTITNFKKEEQYSNKELLDIFNQMFDGQFTMEDIENCEDIIYLIENAVKKPIQNMLNSTIFQTLIAGAQREV